MTAGWWGGVKLGRRGDAETIYSVGASFGVNFAVSTISVDEGSCRDC